MPAQLPTETTATAADVADLARCAAEAVWPVVADHPWAVVVAAAVASPMFALAYKIAAHIVATTPTTIDDKILDVVARVADTITSAKHKRPDR